MYAQSNYSTLANKLVRSVFLHKWYVGVFFCRVFNFYLILRKNSVPPENGYDILIFGYLCLFLLEEAWAVPYWRHDLSWTHLNPGFLDEIGLFLNMISIICKMNVCQLYFDVNLIYVFTSTLCMMTSPWPRPSGGCLSWPPWTRWPCRSRQWWRPGPPPARICPSLQLWMGGGAPFDHDDNV